MSSNAFLNRRFSVENIDLYNDCNVPINRRKFLERDHYFPSNNRSNIDLYYSKKNQQFDLYSPQDHCDANLLHLSRQPQIRQDHEKLERETGKFLLNDNFSALNNNDGDYNINNPHYGYNNSSILHKGKKTRLYQNQSMSLDYDDQNDLHYLNKDKNLNNNLYNSYKNQQTMQYSKELNNSK